MSRAAGAGGWAIGMVAVATAAMVFVAAAGSAGEARLRWARVGASVVAGTAEAVDGDTLRAYVRHSCFGEVPETVRVLNVDTPERGEAGYEGATAFLAGLLRGRADGLWLLYTRPVVRDRYGRLLAYPMIWRPFRRSVNVALEIVRAGWSPYVTRYGEAPGRWHRLFMEAEEEACGTARPGVVFSPGRCESIQRLVPRDDGP